MSEERFQHPEGDGLQAILDSARDFGLADSELWQAVNEGSLMAGPHTTVPEFLDQLCALLAQRILLKEREVDAHRRP